MNKELNNIIDSIGFPVGVIVAIISWHQLAEGVNKPFSFIFLILSMIILFFEWNKNRNR